jgi:drug/metabolite transporter (DMT)-like permease
MNMFISPLLAVSLALSSSMAYAGGPVVIAEEGQPEVIAEKPASSVGILPLLLGVVILCVVLCGNDDDPPPT